MTPRLLVCLKCFNIPLQIFITFLSTLHAQSTNSPSRPLICYDSSLHDYRICVPGEVCQNTTIFNYGFSMSAAFSCSTIEDCTALQAGNNSCSSLPHANQANGTQTCCCSQDGCNYDNGHHWEPRTHAPTLASYETFPPGISCWQGVNSTEGEWITCPSWESCYNAPNFGIFGGCHQKEYCATNEIVQSICDPETGNGHPCCCSTEYCNNPEMAPLPTTLHVVSSKSTIPENTGSTTILQTLSCYLGSDAEDVTPVFCFPGEFCYNRTTYHGNKPSTYKFGCMKHVECENNHAVDQCYNSSTFLTKDTYCCCRTTYCNDAAQIPIVELTSSVASSVRDSTISNAVTTPRPQTTLSLLLICYSSQVQPPDYEVCNTGEVCMNTTIYEYGFPQWETTAYSCASIRDCTSNNASVGTCGPIPHANIANATRTCCCDSDDCNTDHGTHWTPATTVPTLPSEQTSPPDILCWQGSNLTTGQWISCPGWEECYNAPSFEVFGCHSKEYCEANEIEQENCDPSSGSGHPCCCGTSLCNNPHNPPTTPKPQTPPTPPPTLQCYDGLSLESAKVVTCNQGDWCFNETIWLAGQEPTYTFKCTSRRSCEKAGTLNKCFNISAILLGTSQCCCETDGCNLPSHPIPTTVSGQTHSSTQPNTRPTTSPYALHCYMGTNLANLQHFPCDPGQFCLNETSVHNDEPPSYLWRCANPTVCENQHAVGTCHNGSSMGFFHEYCCCDTDYCNLSPMLTTLGPMGTTMQTTTAVETTSFATSTAPTSLTTVVYTGSTTASGPVLICYNNQHGETDYDLCAAGQLCSNTTFYSYGFPDYNSTAYGCASAQQCRSMGAGNNLCSPIPLASSSRGTLTCCCDQDTCNYDKGHHWTIETTIPTLPTGETKPPSKVCWEGSSLTSGDWTFCGYWEECFAAPDFNVFGCHSVDYCKTNKIEKPTCGTGHACCCNSTYCNNPTRAPTTTMKTSKTTKTSTSTAAQSSSSTPKTTTAAATSTTSSQETAPTTITSSTSRLTTLRTTLFTPTPSPTGIEIPLICYDSNAKDYNVCGSGDVCMNSTLFEYGFPLYNTTLYGCVSLQDCEALGAGNNLCSPEPLASVMNASQACCCSYHDGCNYDNGTHWIPKTTVPPTDQTFPPGLTCWSGTSISNGSWILCPGWEECYSASDFNLFGCHSLEYCKENKIENVSCGQEDSLGHPCCCNTTYCNNPTAAPTIPTTTGSIATSKPTTSPPVSTQVTPVSYTGTITTSTQGQTMTPHSTPQLPLLCYGEDKSDWILCNAGEICMNSTFYEYGHPLWNTSIFACATHSLCSNLQIDDYGCTPLPHENQANVTRTCCCNTDFCNYSNGTHWVAPTTTPTHPPTDQTEPPGLQCWQGTNFTSGKWVTCPYWEECYSAPDFKEFGCHSREFCQTNGIEKLSCGMVGSLGHPCCCNSTFCNNPSNSPTTTTQGPTTSPLMLNCYKGSKAESAELIACNPGQMCFNQTNIYLNIATTYTFRCANYSECDMDNAINACYNTSGLGIVIGYCCCSETGCNIPSRPVIPTTTTVPPTTQTQITTTQKRFSCYSGTTYEDAIPVLCDPGQICFNETSTTSGGSPIYVFKCADPSECEAHQALNTCHSGSASGFTSDYCCCSTDNCNKGPLLGTTTAGTEFPRTSQRTTEVTILSSTTTGFPPRTTTVKTSTTISTASTARTMQSTSKRTQETQSTGRTTTTKRFHWTSPNLPPITTAGAHQIFGSSMICFVYLISSALRI